MTPTQFAPMEFEEVKKGTAGGTQPDDIGRKTVAAIRSAIDAAGETASGKTAASLNYIQSPTQLTIFAEGAHAPIPTLQYGARPTPRGGNGFLPAIVQWVKDKGLQVKQGPRQSLEAAQKAAASAIYAKIWREGTDRHITPRHDIYTPALEQAVKDFETIVGDYIVNKILY